LVVFTDSLTVTVSDSYTLTVKLAYSFSDSLSTSISDTYTLTIKISYSFSDGLTITITDTYTLTVKTVTQYSFSDSISVTISDTYTLTVKTPTAYSFEDTLSITISDTYVIQLSTQFPSGWKYRKTINVNTQSPYNNGLSYYAIKFKLYYGSGTDNPSTFEIYLNGHARADFGDVRFVSDPDTPNMTLLPYWFEYKSDGDYVIVWVKVPVNQNYTWLGLYYGNENAQYVGDPTQVFNFFDDFTTYRSTNYTWSNLVTESFGGKYVMSVVAGNAETALTLTSSVSNIGIEFTYYIVSIGSYGPRAGINFRESGTGRQYLLINEIGSASSNYYWLGYYDGSSATKLTYDGNTYSVGVWYRNYFYRDSSTGKLVGTLGASTVMTATHTTLTLFNGVGFNTWDAGNKYYIGWIAVRDYTDPEPSLNSVGSEESLAVTYSFTDDIVITLTDDYSLTIKSPLAFTDLANVSITDNYIVSLGLIFTDLININITDKYMLKTPYTFDDLLNITILDKYTLTVGVVGALEFVDTLSIDIKDVYYLKPPKPLANAYVEIYDENGNLVVSGYTDSYGRVSFFIPIGKYRVRVSKPFYYPTEFDEELKESKVRKVYLKPYQE